MNQWMRQSGVADHLPSLPDTVGVVLGLLMVVAMPRKSRRLPMAKPRCEPEAAAFGVTTGGNALPTAARPWPSVKQPTVRTDRGGT